MAAHFAAHWVDITVKSSLTWGIGLLQCFLTKAWLVFEEGIFLCMPVVLGFHPPPHTLTAINLLGYCKDSKGQLVSG